MTDTLDPSPMASTKPTALAYALGSLTERILALTEEQGRSRTTMEAMPARVEVLINPRLVTLETSSKDHNRRLLRLEKDRWMVLGGGAVVFAIGSIVFGHTLH